MSGAKKNLAAPVGNHAALVRGDDGNLHIRHFPTAAEAVRASSEHRELPSLAELDLVMGRRGGEIRSTDLADRLGVSARTIRRAYERGELPGSKEHGPRILMVPMHLYRLILAYGLHGVGRMAKAGML